MCYSLFQLIAFFCHCFTNIELLYFKFLDIIKLFKITFKFVHVQTILNIKAFHLRDKGRQRPTNRNGQQSKQDIVNVEISL